MRSHENTGVEHGMIRLRTLICNNPHSVDADCTPRSGHSPRMSPQDISRLATILLKRVRIGVKVTVRNRLTSSVPYRALDQITFIYEHDRIP